MHAVSVDEFVSTCRAAAAAGAVNEGGDAGRAMRRAQLARLTGAKDCVFVDAGGSIDAAAAAVESALVTLAPAMGFSPTEDVQVLTPGNKGLLGAKELNERLRPLLNPRYAETPSLLHISLPILREYPALALVYNRYFHQLTRRACVRAIMCVHEFVPDLLLRMALML